MADAAWKIWSLIITRICNRPGVSRGRRVGERMWPFYLVDVVRIVRVSLVYPREYFLEDHVLVDREERQELVGRLQTFREASWGRQRGTLEDAEEHLDAGKDVRLACGGKAS